jgi:Domain of unknown function (DUF4266)
MVGTPLRVAVVMAIAIVASALGGCTPVKPYERGRLAHPSMSGSRASGQGESHMQAVHEGAAGGTLGAESGCGCN